MYWLEYLDWLAFYELEPWGCEVDDDRFTKLFNAAGQTKEWIPVSEVFPRSRVTHEKSKADRQKMLAVNLKAALMQHNVNEALRDAAKQEGSSPK